MKELLEQRVVRVWGYGVEILNIMYYRYQLKSPHIEDHILDWEMQC